MPFSNEGTYSLEKGIIHSRGKAPRMSLEKGKSEIGLSKPSGGEATRLT